MKIYLLVLFTALLCINAFSQSKNAADTLKRGDNRNMMLNAESAIRLF